MSTLLQSINKNKTVEFIVFGFIRNIQHIITKQIIPVSIIKLCINFYLTKNTLIISICQNDLIEKFPEINITQWDTEQKIHYQCNVRNCVF